MKSIDGCKPFKKILNKPAIINNRDRNYSKFPDSNDLFTLTIDGQINFELSSKICIKIVKANYNAKLINLFSSEYFDILRNKMGWLGKIR